MREQIRRGVFETNSSSTHSLTLCTVSEYEQWKDGELYFSYWDEKFITKDEYEALGIKCECDEDDYCDCDIEYYSYEAFWNKVEDEYDTFEDRKDGVVAFGYFGYDR